MPLEKQSPAILRFGVFEVDVRAGELRKQGVRIKLQEQPFQILCTLLEHRGELVTREELRNRLWPADTFVDFDHSLNAAIKRLRDALGESADAPVFIETMARRGYRFIAPLETRPDSIETNLSTDAQGQGIFQRAGTVMGGGGHWKSMAPAGVAVLALAVVGYFYFPRAPKLTGRDTIVLTDFVNTTGDSVFDDTLKQGLRVQLSVALPEHPFGPESG
jgi:eukaryotic-like serine/threonine-protein kinase